MLARGLAVALIVVVLDQLSKEAVLRHFALGYREAITSFFNITLTFNRGISFGLFNQSTELNPFILSLVAAVIVVALIYWLIRVESPLLAVAIGLVIGGATGNVIDRIGRQNHAVIDFLDFHIGNLPHWPAFNVADSAICVGVAVMLLDSLLMRREAH
jgi:signal peptidase II